MHMLKLMMLVVCLAVGGALHAAEPTKPVQSTRTKITKAKKHRPALNVAAAAFTALPVLPLVEGTRPERAFDDAQTAAIQTGHMVCELGNSVTVTPDPQQPARFIVQMKTHQFYMTPVKTTTGAVRLEDPQAGGTWLQLPHKSMLLNSKLGQRMADECQSDHQTRVAHRMKQEPLASLLDRPALAKQ